MSENKRARGAVTLLVLLAIASFAAATITITNITEWTVRAKAPPIVKTPGEDADNTRYIYTDFTSYTGDDGKTRVKITVTGFRGDATKYDEIIKICNHDSVSYDVTLTYKGKLYGDWEYVKYIMFWIARQGPLTITSAGADGSAATTIPGGQCASVAVEVLVSGDLPDDLLNTDLLTIEIDVVSSTSPE